MFSVVFSFASGYSTRFSLQQLITQLPTKINVFPAISLFPYTLNTEREPVVLK